MNPLYPWRVDFAAAAVARRSPDAILSLYPATNKKSSAMRTAMPLVTCSSTHDCGPSATSGEHFDTAVIGLDAARWRPSSPAQAFAFNWYSKT